MAHKLVTYFPCNSVQLFVGNATVVSLCSAECLSMKLSEHKPTHTHLQISVDLTKLQIISLKQTATAHAPCSPFTCTVKEISPAS